MGGYRSKRLLDLAAACIAILVFSPLALGVSIAIWLDDRGAPLFFQPRIGDGRHPFIILKFRSMKNRRVTRVGRWLRRSGIDELPQFVNVWRGEMSVVGPRPLTAADIERLGWDDASHDWRYSIKPGITGLSQLLAGRGSRFCTRLEKIYLHRQGLLLDLRLVALSFAVNIFGKHEIRRWLREMRYSRHECRRPR